MGTTFVPCDMAGAWQEEKECILQDMNRVYAFCAFAFSCFIAQLSFVLKKMPGLRRGLSVWMVQTNSNSTLETGGMIVITAWAFLGSFLFAICKLRREDRT